jgi:hypothetical protein
MSRSLSKSVRFTYAICAEALIVQGVVVTIFVPAMSLHMMSTDRRVGAGVSCRDEAVDALFPDHGDPCRLLRRACESTRPNDDGVNAESRSFLVHCSRNQRRSNESKSARMRVCVM